MTEFKHDFYIEMQIMNYVIKMHSVQKIKTSQKMIKTLTKLNVRKLDSRAKTWWITKFR